ncbi:GNAT family N-acetyltransferase [Rubrivirga sp. IMCC43871]|uniref:GNAT family N-acetyltransferase n=1 Tax=Rubrivirga sp. IMCC43871 TaxID=3391575 RepID=UPI00398FF0E4
MGTFEIRLLGPDDAHVLDDLDPDVFDGPLRPDSTAAVLANPDHLLAVALAGTRVVGMASSIILTEPDKRPALYVDEIGTAEAYRRRGIATALMAATLDAARARGCTGAWLMTEDDNATARAFYRAIGGTEAQRPVYITFDLSADG